LEFALDFDALGHALFLNLDEFIVLDLAEEEPDEIRGADD
jgi:hypothetical protein